MATSGAPDNNQSVIRRSGTATKSNVTTIGIGDNEMTKVSINYPADLDVLPRDAEKPLGDDGIKIGTNAQLSYSHTKVQPASGYDIHGQLIEAAIATATTFDNDEAADDNGRVDNGQFLYRRSNVDNLKNYDLKTV